MVPAATMTFCSVGWDKADAGCAVILDVDLENTLARQGVEVWSVRHAVPVPWPGEGAEHRARIDGRGIPKGTRLASPRVGWVRHAWDLAESGHLILLSLVSRHF